MRSEDGTIAGSALQIDQAVRNLMTYAGIPFESAIIHATRGPARLLGLDREIGTLAAGKARRPRGVGRTHHADRHDRGRHRRVRSEPTATDQRPHLTSPASVLGAIAASAVGTDVYLFLIGMTALAEFAQRDGVFAWAAVRAIRIAGRSRLRLFATRVRRAGIVTTALLSNDATVILLTPAVLGALARYDAAPLPYAVACALVANAASFVLPISNPSNLLVFAGRMPALVPWLVAFASALASSRWQ